MPFRPLAPRVLLCSAGGVLCAFLSSVAPAQDSAPLPDPGPSYREPYVTFFPPVAPIYGAPLPQSSSQTTARINGRLMEPPDELADFVGEIFYPAIGSRLFGSSLSGKLEARLVAYRTQRLALLDELSLVLAEQRNSTPAERERVVRAFAPKQADRIAELEAEAERLRRDLIKGGFLSEDLDWNFVRSWRLGQPAVAAGPAKADAEFQVARAAAFFQDGLTIEQRGLVRELAVELRRAGHAARGRPPARDDDLQAMFFSPETARLHLPQPLPAELVTRVGRYNAEKAALKRELLEAIVKFDALSDSKRAARFRDLASHHAPRIAALEQLAEEIRVGLAGLPTRSPSLPPIAPELRERIDHYTRDRQALAAEAVAAQQRALASVQTNWSEFFRMTPAQRERVTRERRELQAETVRAAAQEFSRQNAERIGLLRQRYDQIRADLDLAARDLVDPRTRQPMTVAKLLELYHVAMQQFDAIGREEAMYERYKYAMLQPGLSPGQRRLLFRAAHAGLAQALPGAEVATSIQSRPRTVY